MQRKPYESNNYNFDRLLRNFRNRVKKSGKLEEFRKKQYYTKPAQRRQEKMNAAKRREAQIHKENTLKPLPRHLR
jgi:small subunit ribosomal protein S21